jgi:hypothetical protein
MSDVTRKMPAIKQGDPHAAEAMRRLLFESARRTARVNRGGGGQRLASWPALPAPTAPVEDILAVDEALGPLAVRDDNAAELVKLHYFARLSIL